MVLWCLMVIFDANCSSGVMFTHTYFFDACFLCCYVFISNSLSLYAIVALA